MYNELIDELWIVSVQMNSMFQIGFMTLLCWSGLGNILLLVTITYYVISVYHKFKIPNTCEDEERMNIINEHNKRELFSLLHGIHVFFVCECNLLWTLVVSTNKQNKRPHSAKTGKIQFGCSRKSKRRVYLNRIAIKITICKNWTVWMCSFFFKCSFLFVSSVQPNQVN